VSDKTVYVLDDEFSRKLSESKNNSMPESSSENKLTVDSIRSRLGKDAVITESESTINVKRYIRG